MFKCKPAVRALKTVNPLAAMHLPSGSVIAWADRDDVLTFLAFVRQDDEAEQCWLDINGEAFDFGLIPDWAWPVTVMWEPR
jgi:hypothetical protein